MPIRHWCVTVIALLVAVGIGFFVGQIGPTASLRSDGLSDFMEGWALIRQGNGALQSGTPASGTQWVSEGIGYLGAANQDLQDAGIKNTEAVYDSVLRIEGDVTTGHETARDRRELGAFVTLFRPFARTNPWTIAAGQFQAAVNAFTGSSG